MNFWNLRKPADYTKAKITQAQILNMKISNDNNIANARRLVALDLPPEEVPVDDGKTADQVQQDVALQESDCVANLLQLGFKYTDVQTIVAQLDADERLMFNSTYPAISQNIKAQYNIKLMSATSFIEYLQQYFTELNNSRGLGTLTSSFITNKFNVLIDSVAELNNIIPTADQFSFLRRTAIDIQRSLSSAEQAYYRPVLDRLALIEQHMPSDALMQQINRQMGAGGDSVLAFQTIQEIQTALQDMPTRDQMELLKSEIVDGNISNEGKLHAIQDMIGGISDSSLSLLELLNGDPMAISLQKPSSMQTPFGSTWTVRGKSIISSKDGYESRITIPSIKAGLLKAQTSGDTRSADFYNGLPKTITAIIAYIEATDTGGGKVPPTVNLKTESGIKVGKGINYTQEPKYKTFGKYIINWNKLIQDDIFNVKYPSGGAIPHFKPTRITDKFQDFLIDFVEKNGINSKLYDQDPEDEKRLFESVTTGAGVFHKLQLKKRKLDDDADQTRFEILRGELQSGNNSPIIQNELRKIIMKFINEKRITKTEGYEILLKLN